MEAKKEKRKLKLFDLQLFPHIDTRTKYTALENGHTIMIPENVWFISTANRDESTFEISDKVYDRAQTIMFTKRAEKVVIDEKNKKVVPKKFVPYSTLRALLNESHKKYEFDAAKNPIINRVEKLLEPYQISFGNRILNQIEMFVKCYIGCSVIEKEADIAKYAKEAIDSIMLTKVLRKLETKMVDSSIAEGFASLKLTKCSEFLKTLTGK